MRLLAEVLCRRREAFTTCTSSLTFRARSSLRRGRRGLLGSLTLFYRQRVDRRHLVLQRVVDEPVPRDRELPLELLAHDLDLEALTAARYRVTHSGRVRVSRMRFEGRSVVGRRRARRRLGENAALLSADVRDLHRLRLERGAEEIFDLLHRRHRSRSGRVSVTCVPCRWNRGAES